MDRGDEYRHGFPEEVWSRAKEEARAILVQQARRQLPLSYSELCERLSSITFDPHDQRFAHFLGQISTAEHDAGRPLLTALVVHKHDNAPGDGFFNLAESLGYRVVDRAKFWIDQINELKVYHAR